MYQIQSVFSGVVREGKKYGRKIGFPTANLDIKEIDLPHGIYAGFVTLENRKYLGAIVIDPTPSFEVHLINFKEDIYGKNLEVEILEFIREFQEFKSEKELISQIKKDIEKIKDSLSL